MINNDAPITGTVLPTPITRRQAMAATLTPAVDPVVSEIPIPDPIPTNANPTVADWIKSIAKCILAVVAITVGMLLSLLNGRQTLADVTFVQWLWILSYILMAGGLVWKVPNKTL
jgi:energy-converting hydrogenase Eha subunit E